MAASRTGALVAGLYAGIGIGSAGAMGTPAGQATFWTSVVAAAGALALILIALWLESICRIPVRPDDEPRGLG
jgi:high-affinity Fe2+/Pb2+ permease